MKTDGLHCISSLGCPEVSLRGLFDLAARHGIGGVELRTLAGTLDLPAYFRSEFGAPAAFAEFVRTQPVCVVGLNTSLRLVGQGKTEREAFLEFLPWAEALGGVRLRVFDGGRNMDGAELDEAAATMTWWQEERATHGWNSDVMVETHDSLLTASAIRRFLDAAPPGTAILWDTHHTWRIGGEDPVETWGAVGEFVVHLHVKDSVSLADGRKCNYAYVLPGAGEFPMQSLQEALRGGCYAGPISLEWEKQWHPELPPLSAALENAIATGWW